MNLMGIKKRVCPSMGTLRGISLGILLGILLMIGSCSEEFLEIPPNGELSQKVLADHEGVDALLIGAYSMLDGLAEGTVGLVFGATSGWIFGSIRGLEANQGTDAGDSSPINPIHNGMRKTPPTPILDVKWRAVL
jgi:hypothetical protein